MNKKILAALLAALMLAPTFTACSESTTNSDSTAETTADASAPSAEAETVPEETEPEDPRAAISDDLPDIKFDGQNFRVLTTEGGAIYGFDYSTEIIAEELNGDACNDAVYNRNLNVETRFDTKITCQMNTSPSTYIKTLVQSGTDEYDIVGMYDFLAYNALNAGAVLNWLEVPTSTSKSLGTTSSPTTARPSTTASTRSAPTLRSPPCCTRTRSSSTAT
ncbi:MAG: hypothetical protein J6C42_05590 [Clostridia bacterium]|nr:hypothetical protein [Clostridia bacterium]